MPAAVSLYENFDETVEPIQCEVNGTLPDWLNGTLLRNGPGMFRIGDTSYKHWFDGLAFIQRYQFKEGQMWFSARYLQSDTYKTNMASNRIVVSEFGTAAFPDPCKNFFYRFLSHFESKIRTDNAVVNFVQNGDKVFATTETPFMRRIDVETLETKEKTSIENAVAVHTETAHHHYDRDGNVYNIGSRFGRNGKFVFVKTAKNSPFEESELIGSVAIGDDFHPPYYHSFGMSANYMVLFECPLRLSVLSMLSQTFTGKSFLDAMSWDPQQMTKAHILNHVTGKQVEISYESKAFFTFHHANAVENDGCLIVDFCKFENGGAITRFTLDEMREGKILQDREDERPYLHRMILPLEIPENAEIGSDLLAEKNFAGKCKAILTAKNTVHLHDERLADIQFEFPRINYEKVNARPYRYVYGSALQQQSLSVYSLIGVEMIGEIESYKGKEEVVKVDVENHSFISWKRERYEQICAEPVFVARPGAVDEDDGILICPVLESTSAGDPFVVVLDARTMAEIARGVVPTRLPMGFHGHYVAPKQ